MVRFVRLRRRRTNKPAPLFNPQSAIRNPQFKKSGALSRILCLAILLPLNSLVPASVSPQAGVFVIYGRVSLPDGSPASRVVVHVTGQSGMDRQIFSDDMGRYEIRDLPRGRYHLTAENRADPNQYTDPVEADTVRAVTNRLLINIYLRTKAIVTTTGDRQGPVVSVAEAAQHIPKNAIKAFEQGVKFRTNGQSEHALESFSRSIDLYPAYFQALSERGHLRIAMGQTGEAAKDFAQALELNPHYEPALRGAGLCKFEQGKFAESIQDLERALAMQSNNATTYLFLGVANLALDHREPALAALQKALSLDSAGAVRARVHLANIYIKERRFQEAVTELQTYLAAAPNAPDAEKLRALETQLLQQLRKN